MAKQGLEKFSDNPPELKSEPRISGDLISFFMLARHLGKTRFVLSRKNHHQSI